MPIIRMDKVARYPLSACCKPAFRSERFANGPASLIYPEANKSALSRESVLVFLVRPRPSCSEADQIEDEGGPPNLEGTFASNSNRVAVENRHWV
jgi:hypothetical protein